MKLTVAQRELLEDKFLLWGKFSREGSMDLRDYNRRCAEALKVALSIAIVHGDDEAPPAPVEEG